MCAYTKTQIFSGRSLRGPENFSSRNRISVFQFLLDLEQDFRPKILPGKKRSRISSEFLDQNQEFSEILLQNQNQDRPNFGRRRPIVIETENPIIGLSDNAISDNNIYSPFYRFKIAINTMRQLCRYRQIAYEDIKEEGYYRDFFGL